MPSLDQPYLAQLVATLALLAGAGPALASGVCPGATHTGPNYSGQNLQDRVFSGQNLQGASFTNAQLQGAVFTDANLTGADFTGALLGVSTATSTQRAASFRRANLTAACFADSGILRTDFQFADLSCTVFAGVDLTTAVFGPVIKAAGPTGSCRTSFQDSTLNCEFVAQWKDLELKRARLQACYDQLAGTDFSNARMEGVIFSGLDLEGASFARALLRGAYFLEARLHGTVFSGADLRLAQLSLADASQAKLDQQTNLSGAHLTGMNLQGADLTGAILQGADGLPAADLSLAYMADTVLTDAKLTGVNLSHSSFYGASAKADNATMELIDLSNSNLGSLTLTQGRLKGARLDASSLVNAKLVGVDLTPTGQGVAASLVQANLQGADLTGARLAGANLSNAAVALDDGVPLFKAAKSLAASLDQRELSAEVANSFSSSGHPLLGCQNPQVVVDRPGMSWQIWLNSAVGLTGTKYAKFALATSGAQIVVQGLNPTLAPAELFRVDKSYSTTLDKELLASGLLAAFRAAQYPLPPCSNPSIAVHTAGSRWELREALTAVTVAGLGYTAYRIVAQPSDLETYGSEVTIVRPDGKGSLTLAPLPIQPTALSATSFDDSTTCPNQQSYGANVRSGVSWKEMMTAVQPPRPPACIPDPTQWPCPAK